MKNLFEQQPYEEVVERLHKLTPRSERQWGKMDVAQMMAHCSAAMEVAQGDRTLNRSLLGFLFGRMVKKRFISGQPVKPGSPTDPTFRIIDQRDFQIEKARLLKHIDRFHKSGPDHIAKGNHPFFGPMTPVEWAQLQYTHLNHHLTQFNV